jgi:hypothetical protein
MQALDVRQNDAFALAMQQAYEARLWLVRHNLLDSFSDFQGLYSIDKGC